ncbi:hypothetical protein EDD37DRAFT_615706 [Exophiala viscosa]|uniref:uncharacterized protein n=1 Tax=Exophiala viscosa TaxID=2486360 RepID=UPI002197BD9A|nr:hypothetical protein EDD37DRAFT_615706 [Exophiala viscosa]
MAPAGARDSLGSLSLPPRPPPAPWTASRCNRILRHLTSFVNRVEKWHQSFLAAQQGERAQADGLREDEQSTSEASDWLTANSKSGTKRPRKNYSTRRTTAPKTPQAKRINPHRQVKTPRNSAELALSAASTGQVAAIGQHNNTTEAKARAWPDETTQPWDNKVTVTMCEAFSHEWSPGTAHLGKEYEDILRQGCSTISTFLSVTADPELSSAWDDSEKLVRKPGARSLFEMALNKVSKHVVEQQKQNDVKNDGYNGQHDFIGSQLQEIEEFFGDSQEGWHMLRHVVRSCGIYTITCMVKSGALLDSAAFHLASRWWIDPSVRDFQHAMRKRLLEAHTHNLDLNVGFHHLPDQTYLDDVTHWEDKVFDLQIRILWTLRAVTEANDPVAVIERFIHFRQLAFLVILRGLKGEGEGPGDADVLLLETIYAGSMSLAGKSDQRVLLRTERAGSSMRHGVHSSSHNAHVMSEALFKRLAYTLTLIWSHCHSAVAAQYRPLVEKFSRSAQMSIELDVYSELSEYQCCLGAQMLFVDICQRLIDGLEVCQGLLNSLDTILTEKGKSNIVLALSAFYAVKQGTQAGQQIIPHLLALDCGHYQDLGRSLAEICSLAAMAYAAAHHVDAGAVRWAEGINEAVAAKVQQSNASGPHTPSSKTLKQYQWDDHIAEWVAKTPVNRHFIQAGHEQNQRSSSDLKSRQALAALSSNSAIAHPAGQPRKGLGREYETHSDGDFVFKRPKRNLGGDENENSKKEKIKRKRWSHLDDESEDELSLLE